MAPIKVPGVQMLVDAFKEHTRQTGFTPSFQAYLGNGNGSTVRCPDYPLPSTNAWVYYYTSDNSRVGRALLDKGIVSYAQADSYYGLPVRIGQLPKGAYAIEGEVVLGLGGIAGLQAAGGSTPIDQQVINNYYITQGQLMPLRPYPSGMKVGVSGPWMYSQPNTGLMEQYQESQIDLTSSQSTLTAGQHRLAVVYFDPYTAALAVVASTAVSAVSALPSRYELGLTTLQSLDMADKVPCGVIYLYYGQTSIIESDILRTFDERSLLVPPNIARRTGGLLQQNQTVYNATVKDRYVGVQAGATVNLPSAAAFGIGNRILIKNDDGLSDAFHGITINPAASEFIGSGVTNVTYIENPYEAKELIAVVSNRWHVANGYRNSIVWRLFYNVTSNGTATITGLPNPTNASDAATKAYVDAAATAVILAPASSTRNIIQPTGDFVALTIKGSVGQLTAPFLVQDSSTNSQFTIGATGQLNAFVWDAATNTVLGPVIGHNSSSAALATFGTSISFQGKDSTTQSVPMGRLRTQWTTPTHASQISKTVLSAYNVGSEIDGLTINGDPTLSQVIIPAPGGTAYALEVDGKVGIIGSTSSVVQMLVKGAASQSVDIFEVQDSSANVYLKVDQTGSLTASVLDTLTNSVLGPNFNHKTTATPAVGFGTQFTLRADDNGAADRALVQLIGTWVTATDASRNARGVFYAYTSAGGQEVMRFEGTGPALSFFGANVATKQTVTGSRGGNVALASLLTALANYGFITDSSTV